MTTKKFQKRIKMFLSLPLSNTCGKLGEQIFQYPRNASISNHLGICRKVAMHQPQALMISEINQIRCSSTNCFSSFIRFLKILFTFICVLSFNFDLFNFDLFNFIKIFPVFNLLINKKNLLVVHPHRLKAINVNANFFKNFRHFSKIF